MKCKNIECENLTTGKRIYCSLKCRNIYVNKYMRDYTKCAETMSGKKEYDKNPKKCEECKTIIEYDKRRNIYCSSNCSAIVENRKRKDNNYKLIHTEETKNKLRELNIGKAKIKANKNGNYYIEHIKCKMCDNKTKNIYCSDVCRKTDKYGNMETFKLYKIYTTFKFSLNYYPTEYNFNLIKEYGWYKAVNNGNNTDGVSRDHIISVKDGFKKMINPLLLSHPANCQLLKHSNNISKNKKSDITIDELLEKIKIFDNKYGKYYINDIPTYITTYDILKEPIFISYTEKNEKIQPKI